MLSKDGSGLGNPGSGNGGNMRDLSVNQTAKKRGI